MRYNFYDMGKKHAILPAIFIVSLSGLSFEIVLTRIFAISLWYHFAFMVISIAMLGIGASGTLLSVYPRLKDSRLIPLYCAAFSVAIPAGYLGINNIPFDPVKLSWDRSQLLYISLYYLFLSLPFFFCGLIISTTFSTLERPPAHIYGADLTGAGTGSLLTIWLLSVGGPERIVFAISAVASLSLFLSGGRKSRVGALIFIFVNAIVIYFQPSFVNLNISSYKPLESALKFPQAEELKTFYSPYSRVDIFRSPAVRFAPGLSFKYSGNIPEQTGISIDAGDIYAVTRGGNRDTLDFIPYLPSSLPYQISDTGKALILEPKGGLPSLTARYYGWTDYKVDSNPLVIRAIREYLGDFSSGIYDSRTWTGIGRSWLASADENFDLIDITLTGSIPAGSSGFSEDYRFTVEAFEKYLSHLTPTGLISVNLYILPPPRAEFRLISTLAAAFDAMGIGDFGSHVAAIRSWGTVTIIVKKTPLSQEDIGNLKTFAADRRFDLIYYPGVREDETNVYVKMPSDEYYKAFTSLIFPDARKGFIDRYLFDIAPVHDENPFFHFYLKLRNIKKIYTMMGEKWQYFVEEGYMLPLIFVQVISLGLVLVVFPALRRKKSADKSSAGNLFFTLSYFALLGIGFMFTEISFIQKMILPLENPPFAMSAVLSSLLFSSGAGSLLSRRFSLLRKSPVLLVISILIVTYSLLLPAVIPLLFPYSLKTKLVAVFIMLLPAGLLIGIPFPLGITLLGESRPALIPWAWAVNGCFSVIAPILAVILALSVGFRAVLAAGAGMYMLAFFSLKSLRHPVLRQSGKLD
ncbi:MAG TPA: hypothetical protein VLD55_06265 [Candidatus Sulfobium mesophilum]|nr:hypothetical protein [Candidatus Sulfobium mesophilum]